jgi:hypothetical protein
MGSPLRAKQVFDHVRVTAFGHTAWTTPWRGDAARASDVDRSAPACESLSATVMVGSEVGPWES